MLVCHFDTIKYEIIYWALLQCTYDNDTYSYMIHLQYGNKLHQQNVWSWNLHHLLGYDDSLTWIYEEPAQLKYNCTQIYYSYASAKIFYMGQSIVTFDNKMCFICAYFMMVPTVPPLVVTITRDVSERFSSSTFSPSNWHVIATDDALLDDTKLPPV